MWRPYPSRTVGPDELEGCGKADAHELSAVCDGPEELLLHGARLCASWAKHKNGSGFGVDVERIVHHRREEGALSAQV